MSGEAWCAAEEPALQPARLIAKSLALADELDAPIAIVRHVACAGEIHARYAVIRARRTWSSGAAVARTQSAELLTHIAGTHQVQRAISVAGCIAGARWAVVAGTGASFPAEDIVRRLGGTPMKDAPSPRSVGDALALTLAEHRDIPSLLEALTLASMDG